MASPPHQRPPADARDLVKQDLARLDVRDDRGTRLSSDDFARQEREELIAPQDVAVAIHDANTVAIAIEGNA